MKPDAVRVVIALVGHVCCTVVEAGRFWNRAGVGVTRTCLDTPPERSVLAPRPEDGASRHTGFSVFHVKPTAMFSSALTPVTVLLRLLHRWSDLSRTHVLHAFAHPTSFRCMINAVITSGSEHFISDERSSRSPSCAGEGGATALVSRETNHQPCRRETLKFARHTCSFPRTPTCFLREQRSS